MTTSLVGEVLNNICSFREYLLAGVGLLGVLLLLTVVGFSVIPPGTGTYVINVLNLIGLSVLIVGMGLLAVYCYRSGRALE